ncbi:urea transporter [Arenibacter sp. 6A1]|uniref:urea transporter n=1 Tax=Arenibacter sp. 6A1 TaxID=2720391 RepID=UPI001445FCE4|nr:urea transporter [Arenibacter sp. 6A1]NKI26939.1 urea transporter [Arenibacter sp. 6A1]
MISKIRQFTAVNLRGVAQIMLQDNAVTGFLFLLGVLYSSWLMGVGLLISTLAGTCVGLFFRKKHHEEFNQGLYGFNAALLGIILVHQYGLNWTSVRWILISSVLATLLMQLAIAKNIKVFTFPFVVLSWVVVSLISTGNILPKVNHPTAAETVLQEPTAEFFEEVLEQIGIDYDSDNIDDDLIFATLGFGQVMFQGTLIAGLLFLMGVYINSPTAALYGIFASILAITVANMFNRPDSAVDTGLFSFNAILCAIAFAGPLRRDGFWVVIATVITVIIDDYMIQTSIPPYTFPFVATMWLILLTRMGLSSIYKFLGI